MAAQYNLMRESIKEAVIDSLKENDEKKQAVDDAEIKKIWTDYQKKEPFAQCDTFLNVNWQKLQEQKDEIVQIYVQYMDRKERIGNFPGFGPFNLILENLCKEKVESVIATTDKFGDRSSMSNRFKELGFKLNNNKITLLEAYLFVYGQSKNQFVSLPPTPASANLRNAENEQKTVLDAHKQREDEITQLKEDLENGKIKKMKVANERMRLAKLEKEFNADQVAMKREKKKAQKVVDDAIKVLEDETAKGTDASNWLKAEIEKHSKKSASAKYGSK